ncbi:MAG TPA: RHS repeat-associated core domain-containing protein [Opitutaceae bacterium]|nr:RHS repeat-associated core domain-containing protein [Opitutaceae bacterium]
MRLSFHLTSAVLLAGGLNLIGPVMPLKAAGASATEHIKANRTLPPGVVSSLPAVEFSSPPTDAQISSARIFPEALVPLGQPTTPEENTALARAITRYENAGAGDDLDMFGDFLAKHPKSPWAASLHLDLGLRYFASAYFSKALSEYAAAWTLSKDATDVRGHAIGDRSIGELLELNARFGRYDVLEKLLKEIDVRPVTGRASELVAGARQGLWLMQHRPEDAFRCGPGALDRILAHQNKDVGFNPKLTGSRSTSRGLSLTQVWKLAHEVGLDYQMAKRAPGAAILAPAVINWKVGHYSALLSEENGACRLEDPTFGAPNSSPYSATRAALDAEASGYFLVPSGPLPAGWQPVGEAEGDTVWGKGAPSGSDSSRDRPYDKRTCPGDTGVPAASTGMPVASATLMICSLNLMDTPLFYTPPKGPAVTFTLTYNQREAYQPTTFTYGNVGNKWTHNWLSYIDEARSTSSPYTYMPTVHLIGGGIEPYPTSTSTTATDLTSYDFSYQTDSRVHLVKTDVNTYTQTNPDGSSYVYGFRVGGVGQRQYFLTKIIDPFGNALVLGYDSYNSQPRLVSITDALGQVTSLAYTWASDPLKLTLVTDPFNRSTQLAYNAAGQLSQITDVFGLVSQLTYQNGSDFISSLITPYGKSLYAYGENGQIRWLTLTDPDGNTERVEYDDNVSPNPDVGTRPTGMSTTGGSANFRNTFYWDKRAYRDHPGDVTAARAYHWLHNNLLQCSGTLGNEKSALEANRVWYNYEGQGDPDFEGTSGNVTAIGRALDNGDSQLYQYTYNSFGKVTKATTKGITSSNTTVLSRETDYVYATNGIDLTEVDQVTGTGGQHDVLAKYTYDTTLVPTPPPHLPTATTDASGQVTQYRYNSAGQIHTVTNAKSETTTFWYTADGSALGSTPDPAATGYLVEIDGPVTGAKTTFSYDDHGRVKIITDSEGYAVTTLYDAFNRPTTITYPDQTTVQNVYDRLDLAAQIDRLGHSTQYHYNALRQLAEVIDPLGRITQYDWCGCGALSSLTDPAGNLTSFAYDLQGRMTGKQYADGHGYTYAYETDSSRLKSVTDALGQVTHYAYNDDDTLHQVSYTDTSGAALNPATPSVTYSYDPVYPRVTTRLDGSTDTTYYAYYPVPSSGTTTGANQLESIDGPLANDTITYTYDELGRTLSTSINGSANASSVIYDALGRVTSATNPLGQFTYGYVDTTGRLDHIIYPNSQRTNYSYYPNSATTPGNDDQRLSQIQNLVAAGGANISTFGYTYDANGIIQTWSKQIDTALALTSTFTYDAADQLKTAVVPSSSSVSTAYRYLYDKGGNRTSEQIDSAVAAATVNNLNQATGFSSTGPVHFTGTLSEPAIVTVNGQSAAVDSGNHFSADVPLAPGTHTVAVVATDGSANARTKHYSVTVADSGATRTLTYDFDGNLTDNGSGQTYTYDAANRLTKITYADNSTTEFTYDGVGQRVKIVEKNSSGTTTSDKRFVWCGGAQPCEERDASNNVTKRFYAQGEQIGGTNYYFTRDHLGSVREMTDSTGAIRARYDYDPYGRRTLVSGTDLADFGFDGMYYHQASGLFFTLDRAYDPSLGRWTTRDPAGENGGINLYDFVGNDPINAVDPLGLCGCAALQQQLAYAESVLAQNQGYFAEGGQYAGLPGFISGADTVSNTATDTGTIAAIRSATYGIKETAGRYGTTIRSTPYIANKVGLGLGILGTAIDANNLRNAINSNDTGGEISGIAAVTLDGLSFIPALGVGITAGQFLANAAITGYSVYENAIDRANTRQSAAMSQKTISIAKATISKLNSELAAGGCH